MEAKELELKKNFGRLVALQKVVKSSWNNASLGEDYGRVLIQIQGIIGEDLSDFALPGSANDRGLSGKTIVNGEILGSKLGQLITYLDYGYNIQEQVREVASLVNAIEDSELRSRCLDLLSAADNFDRVVNQATLILEDRIRKKSKIADRLEGVKLVNKVLNPDLSKTILKTSADADEHQGICDLSRGMMLAFRNPTHHAIVQISRENALRICGMIDVLLETIGQALVVESK